MGKMVMVILAAAEDDVIIMVLLRTALLKKCIPPEPPLPEALEKKLTGLIYGALVNDNTSSTLSYILLFHNTSISISS